MNQHFTTKRDLIGGFASAMNLVSPEVQDHHEKRSGCGTQKASPRNAQAGRSIHFAGCYSFFRKKQYNRPAGFVYIPA